MIDTIAHLFVLLSILLFLNTLYIVLESHFVLSVALQSTAVVTLVILNSLFIFWFRHKAKMLEEAKGEGEFHE